MVTGTLMVKRVLTVVIKLNFIKIVIFVSKSCLICSGYQHIFELIPGYIEALSLLYIIIVLLNRNIARIQCLVIFCLKVLNMLSVDNMFGNVCFFAEYMASKSQFNRNKQSCIYFTIKFDLCIQHKEKTRQFN